MKPQCGTNPVIRALVTKESLRQFYEKFRTKLSQRDCCCDPHLHTNQSGYDVKSHRIHWLMQADNFSLTRCPIYIEPPWLRQRTFFRLHPPTVNSANLEQLCLWPPPGENCTESDIWFYILRHCFILCRLNDFKQNLFSVVVMCRPATMQARMDAWWQSGFWRCDCTFWFNSFLYFIYETSTVFRIVMASFLVELLWFPFLDTKCLCVAFLFTWPTMLTEIVFFSPNVITEGFHFCLRWHFTEE